MRQDATAGRLVIWVAALVACNQQVAVSESPDRTSDTHTREELTEQLANDLLDLAVVWQRREGDAMSRYFGDRLVATPLPSAGRLRPYLKWIEVRQWSALGHIAVAHDRASFVSGLVGFPSTYLVIEDLRFQVQHAEFAPGGARGAAKVYLFVVGRNRDNRREWTTSWLRLAIAKPGSGPWQIAKWHMDSLKSLAATRPMFTEVSEAAGIRAAVPRFGSPGSDMSTARGVALADVDRDGLLDIFTTGVARNHLYANQGDGRFADIALATGLAPVAAGVGGVFFDYDNDGDDDLFITAHGPQILLENRLVPTGRLHFADRSAASGVSVPAVAYGAVATDVDRDGLVDIYVAAANRYGDVMPDSWTAAGNGQGNLLFVNRGDGTFLEAAAAWGIAGSSWSYGVASADVDGDGALDLYVANDFGSNQLWMNRGNRFIDQAEARGLRDFGRSTGASFGDFDCDGDLDLLVTNIYSTAGTRVLGQLFPRASRDELAVRKQTVGSSLYENLGRGRFTDVSEVVGGVAAGWSSTGGIKAGWGFGGGFFDIDNDGWEDIYIPNGFISGQKLHDT